MTVRKQPNGKWLLEIYNGNRRTRKTFPTKGEAVAYETFLIKEAATKPWLDEKIDRRRLSDLVDLWFKSHGCTLSDGVRVKRILDFIVESTGNPNANTFTAKDFSTYRQKRLDGTLKKVASQKPISQRTLNLELVYFRSVFNELKRLGEWQYENPLLSIKQFKIQESEMTYLSLDEIASLLSACKKSNDKELLLKVKIGLSTGARWAEICSLHSKQIQDNKITFIKTKGRRNRSIPIDDDLFKELKKKNSSIFSDRNSDKAFLKALEQCNINLPDGQRTHVLRHTFASHFMINGGNILVLKNILGHTDIKVTMRYAHLAPDHLTDALYLNPISTLKSGGKNGG